jgi:hypothetical protein
VNPNAKPRPVLEAQAMELQLRFAAYMKDHHLTSRVGPGNLVVEKHGLGFLDLAQKERVVWMFWRWLDPSNPVDLIIIGDAVKSQFVTDVNCIVGAVSDDNGSVVYRPHDAAQLEVYKP